MLLEEIEKNFKKDLGAVSDAKLLEEVRIKYLGREKGELTKILRSLGDLSLEEKRKIGPEANTLRKEIEKALNNKLNNLKFSAFSHKKIDVTMPGKKIMLGHLHPLTKVEKDICQIFSRMGFTAIDGPEIESDHYNFDALNIPKDHPARDVWDTFWIRQNEIKNQKSKVKNTERFLLRTHTSPVQIRYMEHHEPPLQVICPGRVYRVEAINATHQINFHQVEGLMVGKDISLANFKYVIEAFLIDFFGKKMPIRFRPSYFPFVEPGLEIDIKLKNKWLEVMGAGMVHRHVFEAVHYNPVEWQGFAFGLGLERMAMIKYGIPDIRLFYENDLRFIKQF